MANEQNLKPFSERTESEQREIRSKGGKSSGKKRQQKADFQEAAKWALEMKTPAMIGGKELKITQTQSIILTLLQIARNPKDKRCIQASQTLIQLSGATKSEAEKRLIEAQAKLIEAKCNLLTSADTTTLDKLDSILQEMRAEAEKGGGAD